ncbi:MAG: ATP-binding protein, partial [Desulfobacterales bacterium]
PKTSDVIDLIHELNIHQAELEIQNEELKRAQQELSESYREYERLYEFAPCGYVNLNAKGIITRANLTAVSLLETTRQFLLHSGFSRFTALGWGHAFLEVLKKAGETGEKQSIELPLKRKKVESFWIRADIEADRDEAGKVNQWRVVLVDVTKKKAAEEVLRKDRKNLEREVKSRTAEIEKQYQQLERLNLIIKQMAQHTIKAMENDRKAMSKDIHDSIGGSLAAIKMLLEQRISQMSASERSIPLDLMPLEKIVTHLQTAINEARRISNQLRPLTLDDFGLKPALAETIKQFKEFYPGIEAVSQIKINCEHLPQEIQTVLYRVVQEALNNVGRHSSATVVQVKLINNQNHILLEIADNGSGFNTRKVLSGKDALIGFGIHSMRERVEICKGKFQIRSEPGKGTSVDVSIPF